MENELKKKNVTPQTLGEEHRKVQKNSPPTICGVALFIYSPPQAIDFPFIAEKKAVKGKRKWRGEWKLTVALIDGVEEVLWLK